MRADSSMRMTTWFNECPHPECRYPNVPAARFCARCGRGMSGVSTPPAWLVPWRGLRGGMVSDEVRAALGEPATVRTSALLGEHWYYSKKWRWTAYCQFAEGRLSDWVEPAGACEL